MHHPPLTIQELDESTLDHEFFTTLGHLKTVNLTIEAACNILRKRIAQGIRTYVARQEHLTVGTASLLVEQKSIHSGGLVGHIEDVATREGYEGRGIGKRLVVHAATEAWRLGCYKVILDCSKENLPFYERCGFRPHEIEMRIDRPEDIQQWSDQLLGGLTS
jgi:glucosamine-phosphate N-acetyltransferase